MPRPHRAVIINYVIKLRLVCRIELISILRKSRLVVTHEVNVVFLSALALSKYIHKYFHVVSVPKATEFREITRWLAIMPFKVIQGHRFWYQWKAHMRLPITD